MQAEDAQALFPSGKTLILLSRALLRRAIPLERGVQGT